MIIIKALKYLNSLPFPVTIKHYQTFGTHSSFFKNNSLNFPESWTVLRQSHPHYSIPETRKEWLKAVELLVTKDGQDKGLTQRAKDIYTLLKQERIKTVFSVGIGGGGLEYQLKKIDPSLKIIGSEYFLPNVKQLKKVFTECNEIILFDILKGDWGQIQQNYLKDKQGALLLYRLDAGFTNEEWQQIFKAIHRAGVENVIYLPTGFLTALSWWNRKSREIRWWLFRVPVSFAGHLRSKKCFQTFWALGYEDELLNFGGLSGFFLQKKP